MHTRTYNQVAAGRVDTFLNGGQQTCVHQVILAVFPGEPATQPLPLSLVCLFAKITHNVLFQGGGCCVNVDKSSDSKELLWYAKYAVGETPMLSIAPDLIPRDQV